MSAEILGPADNAAVLEFIVNQTFSPGVPVHPDVAASA
jgi:hypothetical protein